MLLHGKLRLSCFRVPLRYRGTDLGFSVGRDWNTKKALQRNCVLAYQGSLEEHSQHLGSPAMTVCTLEEPGSCSVHEVECLSSPIWC